MTPGAPCTESAEYPKAVNAQAVLLYEKGDYDAAEPLFREAGSIMAFRLPPEYRYRQVNTNLLGGILCGLGRYAEAEPLLIESYEALRDDPGVAPADKEEMLERLLRLYESWDAAEPNKGYADTAAEYRAMLKNGE